MIGFARPRANSQLGPFCLRSLERGPATHVLPDRRRWLRWAPERCGDGSSPALPTMPRNNIRRPGRGAKSLALRDALRDVDMRGKPGGEAGHVGRCSVVRLARPKRAPAQSDVITAVTHGVLGQYAGDLPPPGPNESLLLALEDTGSMLGALAVEDPNRCKGAPSRIVKGGPVGRVVGIHRGILPVDLLRSQRQTRFASGFPALGGSTTP